jgi:bifunctional DNase/RNase
MFLLGCVAPPHHGCLRWFLEEWVEKLRDGEDELVDMIYEEFEDDVESVKIEIDEDDETYYIRIIISFGGTH